METGQHIWDREKRIDLITSTYVNVSNQELNPSSSLKEEFSYSASVSKENSNYNSKGSSYDGQQPRTVPVFSTKSKKNYLKKRRKKFRLQELSKARQQLEEEERIETEHNQMYEDKMREVEERILRFQQLQLK